MRSGGVDEAFPLAGGEDREFCARWLVSGREMRRVSDAWIDHYHPQTLTQFLSMHYRYGRGAALLHRRRSTSPAAFSSRAFYSDLLRTAAGADQPLGGRLVSLGLVALTQAAAAAGFFKEQVSCPLP